MFLPLSTSFSFGHLDFIFPKGELVYFSIKFISIRNNLLSALSLTRNYFFIVVVAYIYGNVDRNMLLAIMTEIA